jgi:hypothetical protein
MEQALKLIITKSESAMHEAMKCLQAIQVNSPMIQTRYNHVVEIALNDPTADFSQAERALLAEHLEAAETATRDFTLRIRLTDAERTQLQEAANQDRLSMSEYVRRKSFN